MTQKSLSKIEISFIVLSFNKPKVLQRCIESLLSQELDNFEIIIVDSASTENNLQIISSFQKKSGKIKIIQLTKNAGLCKAYNLGIEKASGKYLFVMNHDFLVEKDAIERLHMFIKENIDVGAVMGKIKRYDFKNNRKTDLIDSCGIQMFSNRRFKDIGENQIDHGQFDGTNEIFGVSGAGSLYRKEALESIKFENEYFDEDFFMYKDDIDVSWRLRWQGWKLYCITDAVFWHGRTSGGISEKVKGFKNRLLSVIRNERAKPLYIKKLSFKNQQLLLLKNDTFLEYLKNLFPINIRKFQQFIFNLIIYPKSIFWIKENRKLKKRFHIKRKETINKQNYENVYKFTKSISTIRKLFNFFKSKKIKLILLFLNSLIIILFFVWIFIDIPFTKIGKTPITSSNFIDVIYVKYITERDSVFNRLFDRVLKIHNLDKKEIALELYKYLSPINHKQVIDELIKIYEGKQEWEKIIDVSIEGDARDAIYQFYTAYSYENLNKLEDAKNYYYKALEIESTHEKTIIRLGNILLSEGDYFQVKKIIQPYVNSRQLLGNNICLYWSMTGFSSSKMSCLKSNEEGFYSYNFEPNNSEQIKYIRLDPIGQFYLKEVRINFNNEQESLIFNNFSNWKLSADIEREKSNYFNTIGVDPFLYTALVDAVSIKDIKNIEFIMSESNFYNRSISDLIQKNNEKEF